MNIVIVINSELQFGFVLICEGQEKGLGHREHLLQVLGRILIEILKKVWSVAQLRQVYLFFYFQEIFLGPSEEMCY